MRDRNRDGALLALLLVLPLLLAGCDVAVVAILASRSDKSSSSSAAPAPDTSSKIWLADLSALTAGQLDAEQAALAAAGGVPSTPLWTAAPVSLTSTFEIDLAALALAGPFDTVLVQCPKAQPYSLDAFEVLGANDIVLETGAIAGIRSNFFGTPNEGAGFPNGVTATSNVGVPANDRAFLFCRFATAFTRVRVSLWTPTAGPGPGDVEWAAQYQRNGDQIVSGAAVNSSNQVHASFREGAIYGLLRYGSDGLRTDVNGNEFEAVDISAATVGSASVAIDAADAVLIAVTRTAGADTGNIRIRKYSADLTAPLWGAAGRDFITTGVDRVEWNALAILQTSNDVVVAGGVEFGVGQGIGHFMRRLESSNGNDLWTGTPPPPPLDAGTSYWTAVATSGANGIFSTGDLTNVTTLVPYTRKTTDNSQDVPPGAIVEDWSDPRDEAGNTAGKGQAVGVDSAGNVYVGGYYTRAGTGKDMVLLRYPPAGAPATLHFNPVLAGADEILDLAVAPDDSIYAVGYETVTSPAQGANLVLFRISAAGSLLMKRTVDGLLPNGNDRAVSVVLGSDGGKDHVFVVGEITVDPDAGGPQPAETDVVVRKYVR